MSIVVRFQPAGLTTEQYDESISGSRRLASFLRTGSSTTSASARMGT